MSFPSQRARRSSAGAGTRPPYDGTAKTARSPGSKAGTSAPCGVMSAARAGTPAASAAAAKRSETARVVPAPVKYETTHAVMSMAGFLLVASPDTLPRNGEVGQDASWYPGSQEVV